MRDDITMLTPLSHFVWLLYQSLFLANLSLDWIRGSNVLTQTCWGLVQCIIKYQRYSRRWNAAVHSHLLPTHLYCQLFRVVLWITCKPAYWLVKTGGNLKKILVGAIKLNTNKGLSIWQLFILSLGSGRNNLFVESFGSFRFLFLIMNLFICSPISVPGLIN